MLFNSMSYAIFLPIVFGIYWLLPHRFRWILLLGSSYLFYMCWSAKYAILMLLESVVSWLGAIFIEKAKSNGERKVILCVTLIICVGVLIFFKYSNFLIEIANWLSGIFNISKKWRTLDILLPVGISFYTFQAIGYVIDVYRGEKAEKHFGKYATFIAFFPQLVAGPIERTNCILPQIKRKQEFSYEKATYGLRIMLMGFVKKVIIADNLAIFVDKIYLDCSQYSGFVLLAATMFFAIQIYCDFSGYSDIAVGSAKIFGIDLMDNFKSPYLATSVKEFWARWHISLSTWFRDYLYIPLGGNRVRPIRQKINLLITFLVSGLWHGANITFVCWGALHGVARIIEDGIKKKDKLGSKHLYRIPVVFLFCTVAWTFFRADSINDVWYVYKNMFIGISKPIVYFAAGWNVLMKVYGEMLPFILSMIVFLIFYDILSLKQDVIEQIGRLPMVFRWIYYFALVCLLMVLAPTVEDTAFIYFQF